MILFKLLFLLHAFVGADVIIEPEPFEFHADSEQDHFWARLYNWPAWEQTEWHIAEPTTSNYVLTAKDEGHSEEPLNRLVESEVLSIFDDPSGDEAAALWFFESRRVVFSRNPPTSRREARRLRVQGTGDVENHSGAVFVTRLQLSLPDDLDISSLTSSRLHQAMGIADQPHFSYEVTNEWAHRFLDPLHAGHQWTRENPEAVLSVKILNTQDSLYKCTPLNTLLYTQSELNGLASSQFLVYRNFVLSALSEEVPGASAYNVPGASKSFRYRALFSGNLIKNVENYIDFVDSSGTKTMTITSVIVLSSQIFINDASGIGKLISGFHPTEERPTPIYENNMAYLNDSNMLIDDPVAKADRPESSQPLIPGYVDTCHVGLGLGLAGYSYHLGSEIRNQL